jgi:hypothetical protein
VRADRLEQPERGHEAADDSAKGVEGVESGDVLPAGVGVACCGARGRGQRGAHRKGRDRQHESAERQPGDRGHESAESGRAAAGEIERTDDRQEKRCCRRRHGDDGLECRVETERPDLSIGARSKQQPSNTEAADEDGEYGS